MFLIRGIRVILLFSCMAISIHSPAQQIINSLFKKAVEATGDFKPGTAVSTSLKDSLPGIPYLNNADFNSSDALPIRSFELKPGYYKGTIRSYCLHAGAYSPSSGEGYQLCNFKGSKVSLIQSILLQSARHPEINQGDIQTLIWGIESGVKFTDYPLDFQARVKPILGAKDIAAMEVNTNLIVNRLLPESLRSLADTYRSFRDEITSGEMKYADLEKIAVKSGLPPIGPGSKEIPKGTWSYIGQGFFLRVYPQSYPTSNIELYRPAYLSIVKDNEGRIISVTRENNTVSIQYNDAPGQNLYQLGAGPEVPIWRIKQITFSDPSSGQSISVENKGWIFRGDEQQAENTIKSLQENQLADNNASSHSDNGDLSYQSIFNTLDKIENRYNQAKDLYDKWQTIEKTIDQFYDATHIRPADYYLNETYANIQIQEGLKAALNPTDFKGKSDWIAENMMMVRDLFYYVICNLSGTCDEQNNAKEPPIWKYIAQPGNSSMQRLGLSPYIKKN